MKKKVSLMLAVILILQIMLPMLTIIWENALTIKSVAQEELVEITFEDENMYNKIVSSKELENKISVQEQEKKTIKMTQDNIDSIVFLNLSNQNTPTTKIENINGIEKFTNLKILNLNSNNISNIDSIAKLTNLETLQLYDNQIEDIGKIKSLTKLRNLCLTGNKIKDISSIGDLVNLDTLYLSQYYMGNEGLGGSSGGGTNLTNPVTDISALRNLHNLQYLYLSGLKISNIEPLKPLINLRCLEIEDINIKDDDLQNLKYLKNLETINLENNGITNISILSELPKLQEICLEDNNISDISVLKNFENLTWLHLSNNRIEDISLLDEMTISSIRVNEQKITMNVNTRTIDLPKLLIQARDENSVGYTENEFIFQNCSISDDGTKIILDEGAPVARITIKDAISDWSLAGSQITIYYSEPEKILKGDANGDGKVDFKDILAINKHRLNKAKLEEPYLTAGDVTGDGKVDFMDILQINKYRLGKINIL